MTNSEIAKYNSNLNQDRKDICDQLQKIIDENLNYTESKIWHGHPVWFIDGNPIVGYSSLKNNIQLMFWSGQSFDEPGLTAEGSFKASVAKYTQSDEIDEESLKIWLKKSEDIQWDYKNIVKRKGQLLRLK